MSEIESTIAKRFRGFFPVIIDVETAGFDPTRDALLEIAAVTLKLDHQNSWCIDEVISKHIKPFDGANLDEASLEFTGIDPEHPFRKQIAVSESDAFNSICSREICLKLIIIYLAQASFSLYLYRLALIKNS